MDIYGIGNAVKALIGNFFLGARRSGMTTTMIRGLKPGDLVLCHNGLSADYLKKQLKQLSINGVTVGVWRNGTPMHFIPVSGRCVVTHDLAEAMYTEAINQTYKRIAKMQDSLSGYGKHQELSTPAEERAEWRDSGSSWLGRFKSFR